MSDQSEFGAGAEKHAVAIAGGGPTGLMLAGELALAGIDPIIIERRPNQGLAGARSGGLHARTIEVFDQRGIAERFLAAGTKAQVAGFAGIKLDIGDFPTRHPYGLALRQIHIERILADWVRELRVPTYFSTEVASFSQDDSGVTVALSDGRALRTEYLIGCDGGRSLVRKGAGIAFVGSDPTTSNLIAEVELAQEPEWGIRRNALGIHALSRPENGGPAGVLVTEREVEHTSEPTPEDLREGMVAAFGTDYGVRNVTWLSRFTDATRQAASYRERRVLLAGDAAHIHPPDGGQGLQTGVQDAVNLGWKLAQVIKRTSPDTLLDTYQAERHPVGARVLRNSMASIVLRPADERTTALREVLAELLSVSDARKRFAATLSGLDIHYDLGKGHPLLGRRMPDLDVVTAQGSQQVFNLLHPARPIFLNLGEPNALDVAPWGDRVRRVDARCEGAWELPALGAVAAPSAVLIRPDGHVAWVGEGTDHGLREALTTWFGPMMG